MNNAATWSSDLPVRQDAEDSSLLKRTIGISLLCLGAGVGLGFALYVQSSGGITDGIGLSILRFFGPAAIGALGFAGSAAYGIGQWRRAWKARLTIAQSEWTKSSASLQVRITEARQAAAVADQIRAEAQAESSKLQFVNQKLQAELDQLKRAERTLTRRRQELESSKTVLELHVAERTDELQKLQRRYELILNSAGEGICGLDLHGHAAFANPVFARITGCAAAELLGKTENEIFGAAGTAEKEKHSGERMFRRSDGRVVPIEYVRTTLEDDGKSLGTVLVIKDITERKRVEEAMNQRAAELARSNAELEQFAFVASHDLQEPLRKIQAFGDRLKTKVEGALAEEARDYLERMQ
ncbi:MAG TPA: PAS domain S-box protein, partial [Candidatus Dormibacteraeota bacterium]|nr:PAS domain S-box protein [Candidatus Dormibacteraeota bacterium]